MQTGQLKLAGRGGWLVAQLGCPRSSGSSLIASSVQEGALHCVAEWGRKSASELFQNMSHTLLINKRYLFLHFEGEK